MSAKRFTTEEINFVKEEVSKRGLIINTKECDAVTVVKKKLTWEEIAAAYNKVPSFEKVSFLFYVLFKIYLVFSSS